jgi:hypothetical protein
MLWFFKRALQEHPCHAQPVVEADVLSETVAVLDAAEGHTCPPVCSLTRPVIEAHFIA